MIFQVSQEDHIFSPSGVDGFFPVQFHTGVSEQNLFLALKGGVFVKSDLVKRDY